MKYVYLLRTESGYYKVGVATNVMKRLKNIQTSNPEKVRLVACREVIEAEQLERFIHGKLVKYGTRGGREWFKLDAQQAIEVCIMLNEPVRLEVGVQAAEGDNIDAQALAIFRATGRASTSLLQRKLSIGYGRAAKIMDRLEADGMIAPSDGTAKARRVLI